MSRTTPAEQRNGSRAEPTLDGISREMVMLAAGFCTGLAVTRRHNLNNHERKILKTAGRALLAAGQKLYAEA